MWNYEKPRDIHSVAVKRANTNCFDLVDTLATGGFDSTDGIKLFSLGINKGKNIVEVTVDWTFSGNVFTRIVGRCTLNVK